MRNLITGGAGFLGSNLANRLVDRGEQVVIIDNLSSGYMRNLEHALSSGRATLIFADVAQPPDALETIVRGANPEPFDRIYHLASPASPEAYGKMPWETLCVNAIGTMSLIELALRDRARMLYASTSEIYGDPLVHPQPESYFGNVDPIGPRSCYDEGKRFGEAAMATAFGKRELDGRIVRFFNCYGPAMDVTDGRLVPAMVEALAAGKRLPIHGTGRQTRSMTYVDDALDLVALVMERPQPVLQPVNVGNDDERSVEEIARAVAVAAGIPFDPEFVSPREADPQRRKPDLTTARSYGWAPTTTLEAGLAKTYHWFLETHLAFA